MLLMIRSKKKRNNRQISKHCEGLVTQMNIRLMGVVWLKDNSLLSKRTIFSSIEASADKKPLKDHGNPTYLKKTEIARETSSIYNNYLALKKELWLAYGRNRQTLPNFGSE